jgi:hypothetical protein
LTGITSIADTAGVSATFFTEGDCKYGSIAYWENVKRQLQLLDPKAWRADWEGRSRRIAWIVSKNLPKRGVTGGRVFAVRPRMAAELLVKGTHERATRRQVLDYKCDMQARRHVAAEAERAEYRQAVKFIPRAPQELMHAAIRYQHAVQQCERLTEIIRQVSLVDMRSEIERTLARNHFDMGQQLGDLRIDNAEINRRLDDIGARVARPTLWEQFCQWVQSLRRKRG